MRDVRAVAVAVVGCSELRRRVPGVAVVKEVRGRCRTKGTDEGSAPPPPPLPLLTMAHAALLTVGSTAFTPLVTAFLSPPTLSALAAQGITSILAQVGNSTLPPSWIEGTRLEAGIEVTVVRFMGDLEEKVRGARIVVSHAGKSPAPCPSTPLTSRVQVQDPYYHSYDHIPPRTRLRIDI